MTLFRRLSLSGTVSRATCTLLMALTLLASVRESRAEDEAPVTRGPHAPNAAVIYWQAFAVIPTLNDEERKTLDAALTTTNATPSVDVGPILARHRVALHELQRAFAVAPCDWQLDMEAGPNLMLPHLQKARELSRIALLRARLRFMAGETDAAIDEILTVMKMARDCGSSPILIASLVQIAIEKSATDVLAAHLPQCSTAQIERMESALAKLPPPYPLAEIVRAEQGLFGNWLARSLEAEAAKVSDVKAGGRLLQALSRATGVELLPATAKDGDGKRKVELIESLSIADVRRCVEKLRSDYAELAAIAALPVDQRAARIKAFDSGIEQAAKLRDRADVERYFSTVFLPKIQNVVSREEQYLVRIQLLTQALRIQRSGMETVQPILGRKVIFERKGGGFELRCPTGSGDESLIVGK